MSDTPAKIIGLNLATYVLLGFMVWRVDRDEGITASMLITWAVFACMFVGVTVWHIHRLNRALDQLPREDRSDPPLP